MGWTSMDDMLAEITAGKFNRADWNKITGAAAYTAGRWYDLSSLGGTPVSNSFAGTALTWKTCDDATGNGTDIFGIQHGGNVSTDTKHILNVAAVTGVATGVPCVLMLCDMQGYWPGINMNTLSAQTMLGTPTLRYTNGAGGLLGTIETTGFLDQTADQHREYIASGTVTPTANAPLVLALIGAITTGDSPLKIVVRYRLLTLLT